MASWNLFNYTTARPEAAAIVRGLDADVVAVQELEGTAEDARRLLVELADAADMSCDVGDGQAAVGEADTGLHVGLMWSRRWRCWPGWWRGIGRGQLWHALVTATLTDGEQWFRAASYQASPFSPTRRTEDAARVLATVAGSMYPAAVGGDWNAVSADRTAAGEFYDPDPYRDHPWHREMLYQLTPGCWESPFQVDRQCMELLLRGGLVDAAARAGAPWQATTGHWDKDPHPSRRIDSIRVTEHWRPGRPDSYRVIRTPATEAFGDHLPVVADLDYL